MTHAIKGGRRGTPLHKRKYTSTKAKSIRITHGGRGASALLEAKIDGRSAEGRFIEATMKGMINHLGGERAISAPQRALCETVGRLALLQQLAFGEMLRTGVVKEDAVAPATTVFLGAVGRLAALLSTLGLERKMLDIFPSRREPQPTLMDKVIEAARNIPELDVPADPNDEGDTYVSPERAAAVEQILAAAAAQQQRGDDNANRPAKPSAFESAECSAAPRSDTPIDDVPQDEHPKPNAAT